MPKLELKSAVKYFTYILGSRIIRTPQNILNNYPDLPTTRTWAQQEELPRHLAAQAAQKLITNFNIDPESIDLVLYSTSFPDTVNIGFGPYVLEKIKAPNAAMLQVDCACASFLAQIEIAQALVQNNKHRRVIIICVSHMISRLLYAQEQLPGMHLGEGAAAALIEPGFSNISVISSPAVINNTSSNLFYPQRLENHDWDSHGTPFQFIGSPNTQINFEQHIKKSSQLILQICERHKIRLPDLQNIITNINQKSYLHKLAVELKINPQKFISFFPIWGDLAQATIPVIIAYQKERQLLKNKSIYGLINLSLDTSYNFAGLYWS